MALTFNLVENQLKRRSPQTNNAPRLYGVASVQPEAAYTQRELLSLFGFSNAVVKRFMQAPHIEKRHLILPTPDADGHLPSESSEDLHRKFAKYSLQFADAAVKQAVRNTGLDLQEISYICTVTSTGFLVPGLSARLIKELGLNVHVQKTDIVGMGCNAAVSALIQVRNWAKANPGKYAVLVCAEINSAAYVKDDSIRTGIVNSLFGDNVSALVVGPDSAMLAGTGPLKCMPTLQDFESLNIPEQIDAMRFDFDVAQKRNSFFLSKDIPFVIGTYVPTAVETLLQRHDLEVPDVDHWILHTGGHAVINSMVDQLGLSDWDVRHTRSVLRDFGNVSSGSVLLTLERLLAEDVAKTGDIGVMVAMGPGASIDTALLTWD